MRRVLILNPGSNTLKWSLLDAATEQVLGTDGATWHDQQPRAYATVVVQVLDRVAPVDAAGHRVVHGGAAFTQGALIDDRVRKAIAGLADLAPLHNPIALAGIDAIAAAQPNLPQIAAFDTAFHHTIPEAAATYAVPMAWTRKYGLRRFGFHGLSVSYAVRRSRDLLGAVPARMVVCHLGGGCSVTATREGLSADTSMGFTPLEGVMMGTRSGSVDPGLLLYLLNERDVDARELDQALNHQSGLLGVSGISEDLRQVFAQADGGNADAMLAYAMFVHTLVRAVGGMIAVLGGLDALVFTGGIGEHSARLRADVAAHLDFAGVRLDVDANQRRDGDVDIASAASTARVLVITAREDLAVLAEVRRLLR